MSGQSGNGNTNGTPPGFIQFGDEPWQVTRIEIVTVMTRAWWARNRRNFGLEHAKAMQTLAGEDTAGEVTSGDEQ